MTGTDLGDLEGAGDVGEENPYVLEPDTDFEPVEGTSEAAAERQAGRLRAAIRFHDYRYYVLNDPVIADRTYDELFDRLRALEEAFDLRTGDSPTRRVGGEPVEGIGPKTAGRIREFLGNERNREVIERLRDRGVEPRRTDAETGGELSGLTAVFTGRVEGWTREDLEALVERHGGDATDSVSGNTDYLVVGEGPGETKREDAEAEGVPEIDPEAFFDLLADHGVDAER
jgi:NAD-dependent DNA ligase